MILVIAEQSNGTLNRASWEAVAAAQQSGESITIAVLAALARVVGRRAGHEVELRAPARGELRLVLHVELRGLAAHCAEDLVELPIRAVEGRVPLPDGPGLGHEPDEGRIARHTLRERTFRV